VAGRLVVPAGIGIGAALACAFNPDLCRTIIKLVCEDVSRSLDELTNPMTSRLPLDSGSEEWGRRHGVDPDEARRRGHKIKQDDKMSGPKDKFTVDPDTGDVFDPEGDHVGNLNSANG
jgi:hypothetical protein